MDHHVLINQFYRDGAVGIQVLYITLSLLRISHRAYLQTPVMFMYLMALQGPVAIRNITYTNLSGTSSQPSAVAFDCSKSGSCTEIHVKSMVITGTDGRQTVARCRNAQGDTSGYVYPKIPCLG